MPAAIALSSVSVPDGKLKNALSMVTGSQYLGSAIGPMIGAALVIAFGYRGAIFGSGLAILAVATLVVYRVPADMVRRKEEAGAPQTVLEPFKLSFQLLLATFIDFLLFGLNSFRSVAAPVALQGIARGDVTHLTGVAFALSGVASAAGIWLLTGQWFKRQRPWAAC